MSLLAVTSHANVCELQETDVRPSNHAWLSNTDYLVGESHLDHRFGREIPRETIVPRAVNQ